jgi:hypothetical protein
VHRVNGLAGRRAALQPHGAAVARAPQGVPHAQQRIGAIGLL